MGTFQVFAPKDFAVSRREMAMASLGAVYAAKWIHTVHYYFPSNEFFSG
jgi:hypothetical protein